MSESKLKIFYSSALLRVRAEFCKKDAMAAEIAPKEIFARGVEKLKLIQAQAGIKSIVTFENDFALVWQALRKADLPETFPILMSLVAGLPTFPGLIVEKSDSPENPFSVTFQPQGDAYKQWQYPVFRLFIDEEIKRLGGNDKAAPVSSFYVYQKCIAGEKIEKLAILLQKDLLAQAKTDKPFVLLPFKNTLQIVAVIHDLKYFQETPTRFDEFLTNVQTAERKLAKETSASFHILKNDVIKYIKSALSGPERVGPGMPLMALAAVGRTIVVQEKIAAAVAVAMCKFKITNDKMKAEITGFDTGLYEKVDLKLTSQIIKKNAEDFGIKFGIGQKNLQDIQAAIDQKKDLTGMIIAEGIVGSAKKDPYLYSVFNEKTTGANLEKLSLRDQQVKSSVIPNEVICEMRYKVAEVNGTDVHNQPVLPPSPEPILVKLEEGVKETTPGIFVATIMGVPVIQDLTISIQKTLVHKGDVNLVSGNLRFDGPIEISGSVDTGAIVEATGPITIHGGVLGGTVISGDSIIVSQGILTGETGRIKAHMNISADFIENSRIQAGGDVRAQKSIINSHVIAGSSIATVSPTGILGGGYFATRKQLVAGDVGFSKGVLTEINLGIDFKFEIGIYIFTRRLEKIQKNFKRDYADFRELLSKRPDQLSKKMAELKKILHPKTVKQRKIIERLEKRIETLKHKLVYDPEAKLIAQGILSLNCKIHIGGMRIPIDSELAAISVSGKMRNNSYARALVEPDDKEKKSA